MTQNIANLCVRCETRFKQWVEYHQHVTENKCHKQIKPIRTSDRTKAQIVVDWEFQNKGALIT